VSRHNARGKQVDALTDDFIDRFAVVGTASECIDRVAELRGLGIDEFLLGLPYNDVDPDQAAASHAAFHDTVMPELQRL
jgi:5,10-methylenetetrahydromethanopterin reductase